MRSPDSADSGDSRSGVGEALGDAAIFPARVVARAWRGRLEAAADDVLSAPEIARILDRALAGPLPEELARSLARHHVAERVVRELARTGELERLLDTALQSPDSVELVDRLMASEAMRHTLKRAVGGPEIRAAMASQSAGLMAQVVAGARRAAKGLDGRLGLRRRSRAEAATAFAGVASRGVALVVDALAITAISLITGAAVALVASLAGGVRPDWLAGTLLGVGEFVVAAGYFVLFWSTVGQTPGMRLMGVHIRPGRADRRLTMWQSAVRTLGLALAIIPCFLGFLPALFDPRCRALPDYLAGTVVVYDDSAGTAP
jgi:uncharacterized RDD family membrane protein YckC